MKVTFIELASITVTFIRLDRTARIASAVSETEPAHSGSRAFASAANETAGPPRDRAHRLSSQRDSRPTRFARVARSGLRSNASAASERRGKTGREAREPRERSERHQHSEASNTAARAKRGQTQLRVPASCVDPLDVRVVTAYKWWQGIKEGQGRPGREGSPSQPRFLARAHGTHAEHAATRAEALWACAIRIVDGEDPAPVAGMNRRDPRLTPRPRTQPTKHAW